MEQLKFNTYLKKKKNEMKQQFSGKTKLQRFEIWKETLPCNKRSNLNLRN